MTWSCTLLFCCLQKMFSSTLVVWFVTGWFNKTPKLFISHHEWCFCEQMFKELLFWGIGSVSCWSCRQSIFSKLRKYTECSSFTSQYLMKVKPLRLLCYACGPSPADLFCLISPHPPQSGHWGGTCPASGSVQGRGQPCKLASLPGNSALHMFS